MSYTDNDFINLEYYGGFSNMPNITISESDKSHVDNIFINSSYMGKVLENESPTPPTPTGDIVYEGTITFVDDEGYISGMLTEETSGNIDPSYKYKITIDSDTYEINYGSLYDTEIAQYVSADYDYVCEFYETNTSRLPMIDVIQFFGENKMCSLAIGPADSSSGRGWAITAGDHYVKLEKTNVASWTPALNDSINMSIGFLTDGVFDIGSSTQYNYVVCVTNTYDEQSSTTINFVKLTDYTSFNINPERTGKSITYDEKSYKLLMTNYTNIDFSKQYALYTSEMLVSEIEGLYILYNTPFQSTTYNGHTVYYFGNEEVVKAVCAQYYVES